MSITLFIVAVLGYSALYIISSLGFESSMFAYGVCGLCAFLGIIIEMNIRFKEKSVKKV